MKTIIKFFKIYFFFYVFCACISNAHAGSYQDFFNAIEKDKPEDIFSLINRGFDPNTVNEKGIPALILAAQKKSFKVIAVLAKAPHINLNVTNQASENTLMLAAIDNHIDIARLLIQEGAEVNKTGWTPLHYASTKGHIEMMRLLIENSAYLDAESPNGTTPLMMAAFYGTPMAVKLLLEEGADPLLKNNLGISALEFAQQSPHKESIQYIQAFMAVTTDR